ncbi:MAG: hypothetical protein ABIJ45_14885 [Candidatus Zixiibacteriota bacterium]
MHGRSRAGRNYLQALPFHIENNKKEKENAFLAGKVYAGSLYWRWFYDTDDLSMEQMVLR